MILIKLAREYEEALEKANETYRRMMEYMNSLIAEKLRADNNININFPTKKALKEAVAAGQTVTYYQKEAQQDSIALLWNVRRKVFFDNAQHSRDCAEWAKALAMLEHAAAHIS